MDDEKMFSALSRSPSQSGIPSSVRWETSSAIVSARSNASSANRRPRSQHILDPKDGLAKAKDLAFEKIQKQSGSLTTSFVKFHKSAMMDEFMSSMVQYFQSLFRYHKAHTDSEPHSADDITLSATKEEAYHALKDLGVIYANILLVYSNHEKPLVEKRFFEHLYDYIQYALMAVFDRKYWSAIKKEVGRIFRSEQFSKLNVRLTEPSEQLIPLRKLYSTGSKAPTREDTNERCAIHRAVNSRSPLIAVLFPTARDLADLEIQNTSDPFNDIVAPEKKQGPVDEVAISLLITPKDLEDLRPNAQRQMASSSQNLAIHDKGKVVLPAIASTAAGNAKRQSREAKIKAVQTTSALLSTVLTKTA